MKFFGVIVAATALLCAATTAEASPLRGLAVSCDAKAPIKDNCNGSIRKLNADESTAGCDKMFEVPAFSAKYCLSCKGLAYKALLDDPNTCYVYCGDLPVCGKIENSILNTVLTPTQGKCIIETSDAGGDVAKCLFG